LQKVKRYSLLTVAVILLAAVTPTSAQAQEEAERLAWLTVELWPDYDRPAMLILMTGAVPDTASLPAAVTVPVPEEATINAVARITDDNALIDDIEFVTAEGSVTLTTPDRRFRVEYYAPYDISGGQRSYTFNWVADLAVEEMAVAVQEPEEATSLEVEPAAVEVVPGFEDLNYHNLPPETVPAGVSYTVAVAYQTEGGGTLQGVNWPVLLAAAGGLLVLLALAWQLWGHRLPRGGRRLRKPRPTRSTGARRERDRKERNPKGRAASGQKDTKSRPAKFCHQCGEEVQAGDRFCRNCGTQLKGAG